MVCNEVRHLTKPIINNKNTIPSLFFYLHEPNIKSIEILVQDLEGTCRGMERPCGIDLNLACLHAMQCE